MKKICLLTVLSFLLCNADVNAQSSSAVSHKAEAPKAATDNTKVNKVEDQGNQQLHMYFDESHMMWKFLIKKDKGKIHILASPGPQDGWSIYSHTNDGNDILKPVSIEINELKDKNVDIEKEIIAQPTEIHIDPFGPAWVFNKSSQFIYKFNDIKDIKTFTGVIHYQVVGPDSVLAPSQKSFKLTIK